VWVKPKKAIYI